MKKIILNGRLGKDVQIKEVGDTKVAKFNLAASNGKDVEADWFYPEAWGKAVDWMADFKKGDLVHIEGELQENNGQVNVRIDSIYKPSKTFEVDGVKKHSFSPGGRSAIIEGSIVSNKFRPWELRETKDGRAVLNFLVSVYDGYKTKDGKGSYSYIPVVAWGESAEMLFEHYAPHATIAFTGLPVMRTASIKSNKEGEEYMDVASVEVMFGKVLFPYFITEAKPTTDTAEDVQAEEVVEEVVEVEETEKPTTVKKAVRKSAE